MFKYFQFNLKRISQFLLFLLPISLITGPAIPVVDTDILFLPILFTFLTIAKQTSLLTAPDRFIVFLGILRSLILD